MARVELNKAGIQKIYEQAGERVRTTLRDTVNETAEDDIETATDTLLQRLAQIGVTLPRHTATNAIETIRRGEDFTIELR